MTKNWRRVLGLAVLVLLAAGGLAVQPAAAQMAIGISVRIGPPPLPVYVQPWCPAPGYIWVPGYWAWDGYDYFWVPGQWVLAPEPGLLWTPGYWGWQEGFYRWHPGYWGPRVGFYGGINYGFGYFGVGYAGGYWRGGAFFYNTTVNRVQVTVVHNVYRREVIVNRDDDRRVSYNGGPGGIAARPSRAELVAERQRRFQATPAQARFYDQVRANPRAFARDRAMPDAAGRPAPQFRERPQPQPRAQQYSRPNRAQPPRERVQRGPGRVQAGPPARPRGNPKADRNREPHSERF